MRAPRAGLALCVLLSACSLPDPVLVAYAGPRLPQADVARLDEQPRTEGFEFVASGWTEVRALDGLPVDPPLTLELLPGQHVLLVEAAWDDPAGASRRGQAQLDWLALAGHRYVVRVQSRGLARLLVVIVDVANESVSSWAPAG